MRGSLRLSLALILLTCAGTAAHAQWRITPFVGSAAAGSTGFFDPNLVAGNGHPLFGVALTRDRDARFTFEADTFVAPGFFGSGSLLDSSRVVSVGASAVIAGPRWRRIRPYAAVGIAAMHVTIDDVERLFPSDQWLPALVVGGGATVPLGSGFDLRGDARYVRSRRDEDTIASAGFGYVYLDFWRITAGVVIGR